MSRSATATASVTSVTSPRSAMSFDALHQAVFAVNQPGETLETVSWRGDVRIARPQPALPHAVDRAHAAAPTTRRVWAEGASARRSGARRWHPAGRLDRHRPGHHRRADHDHRAAGRRDRNRATRSLPRGGGAVSAASFDRVDLAVMANRFDGIVREMENTLLRTARSSVIGLCRDFSCSIVEHGRRARRVGRRPSGSRLRIGTRLTRDAHAASRSRGRRRVPPQRPVRRQHARGRPHDPRPHVLRG